MIFPVGPHFNMQNVVTQVVQMYQAKGFSVTVLPMGPAVQIDFRKGDDGITKYAGLALGVKANLTFQAGNMVINFTDQEWTGKIVGLAVGWILCLIPFITSIVGCVQQSSLPKSIGTDIQMLSMA